MVTIQKKVRRIWRPVEWSLNFNIQGGALEQQHDADNNLYYPDRNVTPTLIEPIFRIIDRDTETSREATAELIDVTWKNSVNGGERQGCTAPDYEVYVDGTETIRKGSITVNRNVPYLTLVTLYFEAQWYDKVRKRTMKIGGSLLLNSRAAASLLLFTKLDKPNGVVLDPFELETEPLLPIRPIFQLGNDKLKDISIVGGWWYKVEAGKEIPVNVAEQIEFEGYDAATYTLTVRKDFIQDTILRFKSALFPDKKIPPAPPANCNKNDIRLVRKYPDGVEFSTNLDNNSLISGNITEVIGQATATVAGRGVIADPDKYWRCEWWTKPAAAGTDYTLTSVGFGPVRLPVAVGTELDVEVRIKERGPQAALLEGGKTVMQDGKVVTARKEAI